MTDVEKKYLKMFERALEWLSKLDIRIINNEENFPDSESKIRLVKSCGLLHSNQDCLAFLQNTMQMALGTNEIPNYYVDLVEQLPEIKGDLTFHDFLQLLSKRQENWGNIRINFFLFIRDEKKKILLDIWDNLILKRPISSKGIVFFSPKSYTANEDFSTQFEEIENKVKSKDFSNVPTLTSTSAVRGCISEKILLAFKPGFTDQKDAFLEKAVFIIAEGKLAYKYKYI